MNKDEIETEKAYWIEQFEYYLGNHKRAVEVGARNSEDDNRQRAAQAAAILTALNALTLP